jgi:excisionase family DNA binding protein
LAKVDLLHPRPLDATLTVTRAAEVLGVHANTVRAWSDAGRLRYYRINPRGDRRYRMGDLQRFLAASDATGTPPASEEVRLGVARRRGAVVPLEDHQAMLGLVGELSALSGSAVHDALASPEAPLAAAVRTIHDTLGLVHASAWRIEDGRLAPMAASGPRARAASQLLRRPRRGAR